VKARAPFRMAQQHRQKAKRRHHLLPRWYLAGFTPSGRADDSSVVLDLTCRELRRARPNSVAFENELYSINAPEVRSDAFEDLLAEEDRRAAHALQGIRRAKALSAPDLGALLDFIALVVVRSSRSRRELEFWVQKHTGLGIEQAVEDPANWRWLAELSERGQPSAEYLRLVCSALSRTASGGHADQGLPPGEMIKRTGQQLAATYDKVQFWHVAVMWALYPMLAADLRAKAWSLCLTDEVEPFVCSDRPVGVAWPEDEVTGAYPKYADPKTMVTFPLDRHSAVVAGLESECSVPIPQAAVAEVNAQTMRGRPRFLFASSLRFPFPLPNGTVGRGEDVFQPVHG
jgi:hypothetical protein